MAEYLKLEGMNGIILNIEQFHLGEDTVDWAGLRLSRDKPQPLPEHVKFPRPTNITDFRKYYALVNQVSHLCAVNPHLEPF